MAIFTLNAEADHRSREFRYRLLSREEIVLCTAKDAGYSLLSKPDPARKYPWIDLNLVKDECFLLLKDNMGLGHLGRELLCQFGMDPKTMEMNTIDTVLALVAQKYGVAFASSYRIEEHATAKDLSIFSFGSEPVEWDVAAAFRRDYQITGPLEYLLRLISEMNQPEQ